MRDIPAEKQYQATGDCSIFFQNLRLIAQKHKKMEPLRCRIDCVLDDTTLQYFHFPTLGIDSAARKQLNSRADYARLFADYSHTTLKAQAQTVERVAALSTEASAALMCMEADPAFCHRAHLAALIAKLTQLRIEHISGDY